MRSLLVLSLLGGLVSCAPNYEDAPVRLAGVGYDPDEIGPAPTAYGGVVEYDWVNFGGGALSLSMMGLSGYDEVGPDFAGFAPPYSAVFGFSYIFDHPISAADALGQVGSVPPDVPETCYTSFDAGGPIGSFKTVDVGSYIEFRTTDEDRTGGMRFDRYPYEYPANSQDGFVYYIGIDSWVPEALYGLVPNGPRAQTLDDMDSVVVRRANYPFGQEVEFRFPGGLRGAEAPVASLPQPSTAVSNPTLKLPSDPGGVRMTWNGPQYDKYGAILETDDKYIATCLSFSPPGTPPVAVSDCASVLSSDAAEGQIYTGPWDTDDGQVTFEWEPAENPDEIVSLSVRFLGPLDMDDPAFFEHVVEVQPDEGAQNAWSNTRGIPEGYECPTGRRPAMGCKDQGKDTWVFDDAYLTGDGQPVPALRGDPNSHVAEVTCRLADDGEYVLTNAQLEEALTYARSRGAGGAVFYFSRSTEAEFEVPPAKDQYDHRLEITPIKIANRAIDIGRFWYGE